MENSPSISKQETDEEHGSRAVAPEANQLHGKKLPPERIGQVLVAADMEAVPDKRQPKSAATISRSELLDMSREITVDDTNLRHIYETHLIGENGLRRLVHEHMHGGNMQEALRREILEHETDFERDPRLRNQLLRRDQRPDSVSLQDLLAKAGVVETESISKDSGNDQTATAKKQAPAPDSFEKHLLQQARHRRLLDFAFIGIILILLILVILLALRRG